MRKVKSISNKFRQGLQGQGIDPGKDVFIRVFALARPGVAPT
jgi:hypothetical protein